MRALILETSTEKSCLILACKGKAERSLLLPGGPELSKVLAREVKYLLEDSLPIDFISIGQGPGSYTGTRVGAALAKGLSFGWKIPLYGFCSLKAFIPEKDGPFGVLVDAKIGGFYLLLGERSQENIVCQKPLLVKPEEALCLLQNSLQIVSPHPSLIASRLPTLSVLETFPDINFLSKQAFSLENQTSVELTYLSSP